jgi:cytochrome c oxidase cbb3-type subunit III
LTNRCLIPVGLALVLLCGCDREQRRFRENDQLSSPAQATPVNNLAPGANTGIATGGGPSAQDIYRGNAYALAEGKRLFAFYNCTGCHSRGGGGMGPALMDDEWAYSAAPKEVYESIVAGRPGGMPAFKGKIPEYQVWQLVAYVRSMSGQDSKIAAPSRDDHMYTGKPENRREREHPRPTEHKW